MKIGVPREIHAGEKRVATTPDVAAQLIELGFGVVNVGWVSRPSAPTRAIKKAAAVEMLIECEPSPPVPAVSNKGASTAGQICSDTERIARALPVISSTVSPFMRRATR